MADHPGRLEVRIEAASPSVELHAPSIGRFFDSGCSAFEAAGRAAGIHTFFYDVGGRAVRLRFAGSCLMERLTPALEHLAIAPTADPDLVIDLFDTRSTGTKMPSPPWPADAYGSRGEIRGFNDQRWRTIYSPGVNVLQMYDAHTRRALYWCPRAEDVPRWERAHPLRNVFNWWTRDLPSQVVHAAAIGTPAGAVLLAGSSGAGKSTATLACVLSSLGTAGDDLVLVNLEPAPRAHSLYGSVALTPQILSRFPHEGEASDPPLPEGDDKRVLFLNRGHPHAVHRVLPIRALLVCRFGGGSETRIVAATRLDAMLALAPSSVFLLHGHDELAIQKVSRIVRALPCYTLETGTDLAQIPAAIRTLLAGELHP